MIAGGVACFLNPEPIAAFFDCFLIGEAEAIMPRFLRFLQNNDGLGSLVSMLVSGGTGNLTSLARELLH